MLGFILGIGGTNAYLTSYDQAVNVIGDGEEYDDDRGRISLRHLQLPGRWRFRIFQDSVGRKWKRDREKNPW